MISADRIALFLVGCIGTRLAFVAAAYWARTRPAWLSVGGWLALVPAIGFAVIWGFGLRNSGDEVFGERIWWDALRPIHALIWGSFAAAAIGGRQWAWQILLADVVFGLGAWTWYRLVLGR